MKKQTGEIDNLEILKPMLKFDSEDDFYFLQIIQRKKENPDISSNNVVIKNYFIKSLGHLDDRFYEIKKLCQLFNARAMIRLNRRSFRTVAFKSLQVAANTISNKEYKHVRKAYSKACGNGTSETNKTWVIDVDFHPSSLWLHDFSNAMSLCRPRGDKIKLILPSKNGIHIITSPFDLKYWNEYFADDFDVEFKKDNPTNLYIP